ncbi:MAG: glutamate--cysteine ligase [Methylococcaceae bacterium]
MSTENTRLLTLLLAANQQHLLRQGCKGLEKESLRLGADGMIAHTPHPPGFGSALTHPWITTDYSEALLELITPPFQDSAATLVFLRNIHGFIHRHLNNEVLLATSMPIGLAGDESVPIANYGTSNIGRMKRIYRNGLSYRYGRTMQSIAGIHFNYSVNEALWPVLKDLTEDSNTLSAFISEQYFGAVRNVHRYGWLLIYLFGNSPAICSSFFKGREALADKFQRFDETTLYRPHATSLRMSDIGYRNDNQTSLDISFNNLDEYVACLQAAINKPYPPYEKIGIKVGEEYRQLNANILQIENEYYSLIRPKQVARSGEKPTLALKKRGVRYIELRALDLNCFEPAGVSIDTMHFLEVFVLFCLLKESPPLSTEERAESSRNALSVACCSRTKGFRLFRAGRDIPLAQWANHILDGMLEVAQILDEDTTTRPYTGSVLMQRAAITDPEQGPAARVLREMRNNGESFAEFAWRLSQEHAQYWLNQPLDPAVESQFRQSAADSRLKQAEIEAADTLSFEEFLQAYMNQD